MRDCERIVTVREVTVGEVNVIVREVTVRG